MRGDRVVPFEENELCDQCGEAGAYDFMGDLLCPECARKVLGGGEKDDD